MIKRIFGLVLFAVFLAGCTVSVSPNGTSAPSTTVLSQYGIDVHAAIDSAWNDLSQSTKNAFCKDYKNNSSAVTLKMARSISDTSTSTINVINNFIKSVC